MEIRKIKKINNTDPQKTRVKSGAPQVFAFPVSYKTTTVLLIIQSGKNLASKYMKQNQREKEKIHCHLRTFKTCCVNITRVFCVI